MAIAHTSWLSLHWGTKKTKQNNRINKKHFFAAVENFVRLNYMVHAKLGYQKTFVKWLDCAIIHNTAGNAHASNCNNVLQSSLNGQACRQIIISLAFNANAYNTNQQTEARKHSHRLCLRKKCGGGECHLAQRIFQRILLLLLANIDCKYTHTICGLRTVNGVF